MNRSKKTVSILDVARKANVSSATVSRALNSKTTVSPQTYDAVMEAIRETGYKRSGTNTQAPSNVILLCGSEFLTEFIYGVMDTALKNNYEILVWPMANRSEITSENGELLSFFNTINPAGILINEAIPSMTLKKINKKIPIIQCGEHTCQDIPYVTLNNQNVGEKAASFFSYKGFKSAAYIGEASKPRKGTSVELKNSFVSSCKKLGIELKKKWIIETPDVSPEIALHSIMQILSYSIRPEAIFAYSAMYGAAAIKAARKCNLKVPGDISILAFDSSDICSVTNPTLTTITKPLYKMGIIAAEMILHKIKHRTDDIVPSLVETEMIIRESTR